MRGLEYSGNDAIAYADDLSADSVGMLGMPFATVKLDIERKFFLDANLSWVNEKSC